MLGLNSNFYAIQLVESLLNFTDSGFGKKVYLYCFAVDEISGDTSRNYHSLFYHINPMLQKIYDRRLEYTKQEVEMLMWATLFHDIVYDTRNASGENERLSSDLWLDKVSEFYPEYPEGNVDNVNKMILATYGHESNIPLVTKFLELDLDGFNKPFNEILEAELEIRKEWSWCDWDKYKQGRIAFLTKFTDNKTIRGMGLSEVLRTQAEYMKTVEPKIAIYQGSFHPFHVGHLDVVEKAERIFDKVIIVYAINAKKDYAGRVVPEALRNRQVEFVSGSIVKWIEALPYPVTIIRGLRNSFDLQMEQDYITWLNSYTKKPLQVVNIFPDKHLDHVSSSAIKALAEVDPEEAEKYIVK